MIKTSNLNLLYYTCLRITVSNLDVCNILTLEKVIKKRLGNLSSYSGI